MYTVYQRAGTRGGLELSIIAGFIFLGSKRVSDPMTISWLRLVFAHRIAQDGPILHHGHSGISTAGRNGNKILAVEAISNVGRVGAFILELPTSTMERIARNPELWMMLRDFLPACTTIFFWIQVYLLKSVILVARRRCSMQ